MQNIKKYPMRKDDKFLPGMKQGYLALVYFLCEASLPKVWVLSKK